ncbi:MAG: hypothetical protein R6X06_11320 [Gammaproteobacteria bacterium]
MANQGNRFGRFSVILWLLAMSLPTHAAVVGHYEECSRKGESWIIPAIEAAGHTPKLLTDLTRADLADIDVLFVTNCSLFYHFEEFTRRLPEIHAAVSEGLIMALHDRNVDLAATVLPGLGQHMAFIWNPTTDTQVQDDTTLLTDGPGGVIDNSTLDGGHAASHGYVDANTFPAGVRNLLSQTEANRSVVFSYPHGLGHVLYSSIPLDYYLRFIPYCSFYNVEPVRSLCLQIGYVYTPNVIAYTADLAQRAPQARVAGDVSVDEGQSVVLDGSASVDPQNSPLSYDWQQVSPQQPSQLLDDPSAAQPQFTAPLVTDTLVVTYRLVVTNARGLSSEPVYLNVTVKDVNRAPVADAGDDLAIKAGAMAQLDASRSYDPDDDPLLSYTWRQVAGHPVTLSDSTAVRPEFQVPPAVGERLSFTLEVSDGKAVSEVDTVSLTVLDNTPPLADAGADSVRDEASIVALNGLGSSDADGDVILHHWRQVSGPEVALERSLSATPTFTAPTVAHGGVDLVFELTVTDTDPLKPLSATDQVVVHVRNINDPPRCDLAQPSQELLWPPNHKMVKVSIHGITDEDSLYNQVAINITAITQDEPVDGRGDGRTSPDGVIQRGAPDDSALLRAERSALGNGRVYAIHFEASDGLEVCSGSVSVGVPVSRKNHRADKLKFKHKGNDKGDRHVSPRHDHKRQWQPLDDGQFYDASEAVVGAPTKQQHEALAAKLKAMLKALAKKLGKSDEHAQEQKDKANKKAAAEKQHKSNDKHKNHGR